MSRTAPASLSQLIPSSARLVAESWQDVRRDSSSEGEVAQLLLTLAAAVTAALDGSFDSRAGPPKSQLSRRLLGLIRAQFLAQAGRAENRPDGTGLLACMGAFEAVAVTLEPDWDHQFTDRLTGPDGLDLVVELAHDLRSPLTSILFLAETMKRGRSGPVTPNCTPPRCRIATSMSQRPSIARTPS